MQTDIQGNPITGANTDAVEHYDAAIHAFNIYRGDPVELVDRAINAAPEFTMAHILKAYLFGLATEPEAAAEAITILAEAKKHASSDREQSHIGVLDSLLAGNWTQAAQKLDFHNMQYPHDILGLQTGHLMDFYRANAKDMRDRIARALPHWSKDMPGHSILVGMYAFGLEESGDYARAEAMGREAVAQQPLDCWAHHAVAHVMEMQGRPQDGIGWMKAREPYWSGDDNFFKVHNWWHKALYHLDLEQREEVLGLYDGKVREGQSAVALDLVDASALLWRMHMDGIDVSDRWKEVAEKWEDHADGKLYPFNDWHAAMAFMGAGQSEKVTELIKRYRNASDTGNEMQLWAGKNGLPLVEGFLAFWQQRYDDALKLLYGGRYIVNTFGGSHAQRDIIDWTLTEAAIRSGNTAAAEAIANERLAIKPHSPINRRFLSRAKEGNSRLRNVA